jgi:hypothetical protein
VIVVVLVEVAFLIVVAIAGRRIVALLIDVRDLRSQKEEQNE